MKTSAKLHTTSHSELCVHRPAPKNEDEMMVAIFEYIDRLFNIVRPRRVLYMAIDGVVSYFIFRNNLAGRLYKFVLFFY